MSESNIRFVFDDASATRGPARASASRAEGQATGAIDGGSGLSDNFLLENFKPLATVQLVTSTDNFSNRIIQLLRRDCSSVNTECPKNVLLDNFIFSKNKNCISATTCPGVCIPYLTDGDSTKIYTFQLPAVKLATAAVPVLGYTTDYDAADAAKVYGKNLGAPPSQHAFLYIQAQKLVTTDVGGVPTQSLRKACVVPTALKICFPECGSACQSGFQNYVDDEHAAGGAYASYTTPSALGAGLFPFNYPTAAPTSFRFLHCINASVAEKTQNFNSDADQIPHTQLRFEWQAYTNNAWNTIVVQYECTSIEGCVVFPCLTNYLNGYGYAAGAEADYAGATEYRLAVSRYATALVTGSASPTYATAGLVAWRDMPCISFTLAEIEMIGSECAENPSYDDNVASDCPNNAYVWTAIAPHEAGTSFTTAANATDPDAVGRLTVKQLDGSGGQILEVSNYSTEKHTYRVHVISPNTPFATV